MIVVEQRCLLLVFALLVCSVLIDSQSVSTTAASNDFNDDEIVSKLSTLLENKCFNNIFLAEWWSYIWCYKSGVRQIHYNHHAQSIEMENDLGTYVPEESEFNHQIFRSEKSDCMNEATKQWMPRYVEVTLECCDHTHRAIPSLEAAAEAGGTIIASIQEPVSCSYYMVVCSTALCPESVSPSPSIETDGMNSNRDEHQQQFKEDKEDKKHKPPPHNSHNSNRNEAASLENEDQNYQRYINNHRKQGGRVSALPDDIMQEELLHRVRDMFNHAYDNYMDNAFPDAELKPISCMGGPFDLIKIPLVTLIDTLDSLVIMGNFTEFRRAVALVEEHYPSFDLDVNVSVFETTIRVLGGLLSAHLMAVDENIGVYSSETTKYNGCLLRLAKDLGERLLPAFRTNTGIPYGTVNLRFGVPKGETEIASTAGAGSLVVEFEVLSSLTNDRRFGDVAYAALQALFDRRSSIGLLGKHIHTDTGRWFESVSGIGSNSDSFYEYLLKAYLLFRRKEMYEMFTDTYLAIKRFVQVGDWFSDVDMFNGKLRRNRVENLHAFWPGMEALLGFSDSGARQLNSFYSVWSDLGFLPEEFDNVQWLSGKQSMHGYYPLRPELIESTYYMYRTTRDRSWLIAGMEFLDSIEHTRTECGFATVNNVETMELADVMPSFFLSETLKYLYLLFDENNFVHNRPYIFSTEAHLFDPTQLQTVYREEEVLLKNNVLKNFTTPASISGETIVRELNEENSDNSDFPQSNDSIESSENVDKESLELEEEETSNSNPMEGDTIVLPSKCSKKQWWDVTDSFVSQYIVPPPRDISENGNENRNDDRNSKSGTKSIWSLTGGNEGGNALSMLFNSLTKVNEIVKQEQNKKKGPIPIAARDDAAMQEVKSGAASDVNEKDAFLEYFGNQFPNGNSVVLASLYKSSRIYAQLTKRQLLMRNKSRHFNAKDISKNESENENDNSVPESEAKNVLTGKQFRDTISTTRSRILAQKNNKQQANDNKRRVRRPNTCYNEDQPVAKKHSDALQTVDVTMGPLGDFKVHVYNDGFVVKSKEFGDTLEISNVGQDVMFVRNYNDTDSKAVVGLMTGSVVSCSVLVEGLVDEEGHPIQWERTCAVSSFESSMEAKDYLTDKNLKGPLVVVKDNEFGEEMKHGGNTENPKEIKYQSAPSDVSELGLSCLTDQDKKLLKVKSSGSADSLTKIHENQILENGNAANSLAKWLPFIFSPSLSGENGEGKNPTMTNTKVNQERDNLLDGKEFLEGELKTGGDGKQHDAISDEYKRIGITRRGECIFEEKAEKASLYGLDGLIVVNHEDLLFIMSGRKATMTKKNGKSVKSKNKASWAARSNIGSKSKKRANSILDSKKKKKKEKKKEKRDKMKARKDKAKKDRAKRARAMKKRSLHDHFKEEDSLLENLESNDFIEREDVPEYSEIDDNFTESTEKQKQNKKLKEANPKVVPTVMLSASDGNSLLSVLETHRKQTGKEANVQIEVDTRPMMLDSELFGDDQYPKLRMRDSLVHVLGGGPWGAILTSKNGNEWQLYIIAKSEMTAVEIWQTTVLSPNGQYVTASASLTLNPVNIYARQLKRKCPQSINLIQIDRENENMVEGGGDNEIENGWLAYDEQTDTLHHTSDTNNDEDVSEAIKVTVDDTEYIVDLQLQA